MDDRRLREHAPSPRVDAHAGVDPRPSSRAASAPGVAPDLPHHRGPSPGDTCKVAKLANIIDGTSNTVAFSEIVKGVGGFANNLDNLTPSATPVPLTVASSGVAQTDYTNCKAGVPRTAGVNAGGFPFGATWWWGRSGQNRFTGVMPPNAFSCDFNVNSDSDTDAITAGSRHSGVANCLMMDGSVRAMKSTVNPMTRWALISMAGGEVVSADAY